MQEFNEIGNIHDRISQMVNYFCKGNKAAFGRTVHIQSGVLAGLIGGRKNKPSFDVLQKLLIGYPTVSPDWLLFGMGPMLRKPVSHHTAKEIEHLDVEDISKKIIGTQLAQQDLALSEYDVPINLKNVESEILLLQNDIKQINYRIHLASSENASKDVLILLQDEFISTQKVLVAKSEQLQFFRKLDAIVKEEVQATVYQVEGVADASKPFGGLLAYRLGIAPESATQLVTSGKVRATHIEGEGYRVTEQAVREFLGES